MKKHLARIGLAALVMLAALAFPASAQAAFTGAGYYYAGGRMVITSDLNADGITDYTRGLGANFLVTKPYVSTQAFGGVHDHALAEISLEDSTQQNSIEMGIAVEPDAYGDYNPHLFTCAKKSGVYTNCYNSGASSPNWFDNTGNSVNLGSDLTADIGTAKTLQVFWATGTCGLSANGWFFYYNGSNIGCLDPHAVATGWTEVRVMQAFGEVAYNGGNNSGTAADKPCTDMGTGGAPGVNQSYISSLTTVTPTPATITTAFPLFTSTDANAYTSAVIGTQQRSFYYSGAGYKFSGGVASTPGNTGSC
jgi:hypothetical protein